MIYLEKLRKQFIQSVLKNSTTVIASRGRRVCFLKLEIIL